MVPRYNLSSKPKYSLKRRNTSIPTMFKPTVRLLRTSITRLRHSFRPHNLRNKHSRHSQHLPPGLGLPKVLNTLLSTRLNPTPIRHPTISSRQDHTLLLLNTPSSHPSHRLNMHLHLPPLLPLRHLSQVLLRPLSTPARIPQPTPAWSPVSLISHTPMAAGSPLASQMAIAVALDGTWTCRIPV